MNINIRSFPHASWILAALAALLLGGCGGGSGDLTTVGTAGDGGTTTNSPTPNGTGNSTPTPSGTGTGTGTGTTTAAASKFAALVLDNQTGTLAAGSIVPLACIQGGTVHEPDDVTCFGMHMHDSITIAGVGGPFADPNLNTCGQGRVDIVAESSLSLSCDALAAATPANEPLTVKVDDPQKFGTVMLQLTASDGTTTSRNIKAELSQGVNKLVQTGLNQYVRASLLTYCDLGADGAGVDQVQHTKTTVDLTTGVPQELYAKCTPTSDLATQQLQINLADFSDGNFYTGDGPSPAASLIPGSNVIEATVDPALAQKGGVITGSDSSGRSATAIRYPATGAVPAVAADANSLNPMRLSAVDDGNYLGNSGYQGVNVYALAPGLAQSYDQLDGTTTTDRNIRAVGNLNAIGGIHAIQARFATVEAGTNAAQSATVSRFYTTPPATVAFNEPQPVYFGADSYSTADGAGGFTFTNNYGFGGTALTPVRLSLVAQTPSALGNTLHTWTVNDYSLVGNTTNATWPTGYLTVAANLNSEAVPIPTGADLTRVSYRAATDNVAARDYALDPTSPADPLDGVTQVEVDYGR